MGSYGSLLLLGAIWGASFLLIKIGVTEISPMTFAMLRVAIGAIVLGIVVVVRRVRFPQGPAIWRHLVFMGAFGVAIPFAGITWGTQHIASSLSAILNATMPLFTFLVVVILGSEQTNIMRLLGVLLGFGGIIVLIAPDLVGAGFEVSSLGQLAVIGAAVCYALAVVYANRYLTGFPVLLVSCGQLTLAALMLAPFALLESSWRAPLTMRSIGALVLLGVVGTALAYLIYYRLVRLAGATFTSLVTYITPIFGVFWGRLILDERLSWNAFAALGLILGGLVLVRRRKPHPGEVGQPLALDEQSLQ